MKILEVISIQACFSTSVHSPVQKNQSCHPGGPDVTAAPIYSTPGGHIGLFARTFLEAAIIFKCVERGGTHRRLIKRKVQVCRLCLRAAPRLSHAAARTGTLQARRRRRSEHLLTQLKLWNNGWLTNKRHQVDFFFSKRPFFSSNLWFYFSSSHLRVTEKKRTFPSGNKNRGFLYSF